MKWHLLGHVYSCLQSSSKVDIKYFVSQINISTCHSGKRFVLSLKPIRIWISLWHTWHHDWHGIDKWFIHFTERFIAYRHSRANFVEDILFNFSTSHPLWSWILMTRMTYPFLYPNPRLTLKNFCLRHHQIVVGKGSLSTNPKLALICSQFSAKFPSFSL